MEKRKLSLCIQDFKKLREGNCIYVDKTDYLYNLAEEEKSYFLSRPRRFGKSLFLSTLRYFFEGEKELFKGLKVYDLEKDWIKYPVFYIDFNAESYINIESFYEKVETNLRKIEDIWGKDEREKSFASRFEGLIYRAYKKTRKKVVVLIDEYDKPLLNTMDNEDLNEEISKELNHNSANFR